MANINFKRILPLSQGHTLPPPDDQQVICVHRGEKNPAENMREAAGPENDHSKNK